MEVALNVPGFEGRRLAVRTGGIFSGPGVLLDGVSAPKQKGFYFLTNNQGELVRAKLKTRMFDPIPTFEIAGSTLTLAQPFKWYEHVWVALQGVLVFIGGLIGAICGMSAAYVNERVFRGGMHTIPKYLVTGLISLAALVVSLVLGVLLHIALGR